MLIATLIVAAGLSAQTPAPAPTADALARAYLLFLQGRTLEDSGDRLGSLTAYRKALEIVPDAADIHAELAGLYARANDARNAIAEAEAALKIEPANREAHRLLGLIQASVTENAPRGAAVASMTKEAIGHLEQADADGRTDPMVELTLGRLYVDDRQFAKAIATLRAFLLDEPEPDALILLAEAYDGAGQTSQAIDVLQQLIQADPSQARARGWLAELYERSGKWREAADAWAGLATADAAGKVYRSRYATALVNAGDIAAGRKILQDLVAENPKDTSAWFLLAQVERRTGDAAAAEASARRIGEIDPADARGPLALADALAARGDFKEAAAVLEPRVNAPTQADLTSGTFTRLATSLAAILQQSHDAAGAIAVLENARTKAPGDPELIFELASAYEHGARPDDAEQLYRGVIAADPANAEALNALGYLLADHGRKVDEAIDLLKRALAVDADNPSFLDSLGWAYYKRGTFTEAREPLERAAAALPRTSVIQEHLGDLYVQLKRYRDAVAAYDRALAGDRQGVDVDALAKKRDRARQSGG